MSGRFLCAVLVGVLTVLLASPGSDAGLWDDIVQFTKRLWQGKKKPTESVIPNSEDSEGSWVPVTKDDAEGMIVPAQCPEVVSRNEWGAKEPTSYNNITELPVPYVIIHHTYQPGFCDTDETCETAMKTMQHMHQDIRGWFDIGYNFCVGGNGKLYEGRGWDVQGAHAPKYNTRSTGICFIGDYMEDLPTAEMMSEVKALIQCGVQRGSIAPNYKLLGHRQVRETLCPGDKFYEEIKTWPHYDPMNEVTDYVSTPPTTPTYSTD